MADKMDIDAANGDKEEEKVGPAPNLPAERIITNNFNLINQAVDSFDARFTLRALRSIATIRKATDFPEALAFGIRTAFPKPQNNARRVLEEMLPENVRSGGAQQNGGGEANGAAVKEQDVVEIAEVWVYLGLLVQVSDAQYWVRDAYSTTEPSEAFHARIEALLGMRDECVMAMRYPMNKHRQEIAEAAKARERERELAKEIIEGDADADDGDEGGFEGM
ncbi:26S proteasome non-ATPase regulatory subunit [Rachicladosporium monterosium]|uniref:26S proteasome non-ATPase regulatory subunit n=1 Tax=Rachicladosporium monterosium TaxID=1507873 RepID=A0ABR0LBU0_9PEZI|nr:26S proteasome non-ATPase regulatory subunit [Rachicladosporium monterosium]